MKYAGFFMSEGRYLVTEIFDTPGNETIDSYMPQGDLDLGQVFWVLVEGMDPEVQVDWTATRQGDGWVFSEYVEPPPTPAEVLASQSAKLQQLTQLAAAQKSALTNRIGTIQDAIDMEMATDEEMAELPTRQTQLTAWKKYAILLGRVTSQTGWPPEVVWPEQPKDGMDLSVSATATRSAAS